MEGILIIDKPSGITSFGVVKRVKRVLNVKRVGHTGTLDPMATGVLPICINEATKIVQFLIDDDKEYEACLRLGIETDTQDQTGKVIRESITIPEDQNKIVDTFNEFVGHTKQKPPVFSAIKHKGLPLYKLARRGKNIDIEPRDICIHKIVVSGIDLPYVSFVVSCSKGTYIRTLAADLGNMLGCGAHLVELRRIKSGNFRINDSYSIESLQDLVNGGMIKDKLIPLSRALVDFPQIKVGENLARIIRCGRQIFFNDLKAASLSHFNAGENLRITTFNDELIAVAKSLISYPLSDLNYGRGKVFRLIRVFNA
ncbi:MAG: tRNA pseudouridine(55) synthase TruB [Thermodesulfobacteriota bacterium]|nr:tRNA pseudouridine(55) synthase TruB [Thermodesulfobacteriota bacterium]